MEDIVNHALVFAYNAHAGQLRKYTGEPYITHPISVAQIVREAGGTPEMIAAALLHDVVEDTSATVLGLYELFGNEVSKLVYEVTDVSRPEDGNRERRKEIDRKHIAKASPDGQTIKLADLIHNTASIVRFDKGFAKVYLREKRKLLDALGSGSPILYARALQVLNDAEQVMAQEENA